MIRRGYGTRAGSRLFDRGFKKAVGDRALESQVRDACVIA